MRTSQCEGIAGSPAGPLAMTTHAAPVSSMNSSAAVTDAPDDLCPCDLGFHLDLSRFQCNKSLCVFMEATKCDDAPIPSSVIQYLVQLTYGEGKTWCTKEEICRWVTKQLYERSDTMQDGVSLKVYWIAHELLLYGSSTFVDSMERGLLALLHSRLLRACSTGALPPGEHTLPSDSATTGASGTWTGTKVGHLSGEGSAADESERRDGAPEALSPSGLLENDRRYLEALHDYRCAHRQVNLGSPAADVLADCSLVELRGLLEDTAALLRCVVEVNVAAETFCKLQILVLRQRLVDTQTLFLVALNALAWMLHAGVRHSLSECEHSDVDSALRIDGDEAIGSTWMEDQLRQWRQSTSLLNQTIRQLQRWWADLVVCLGAERLRTLNLVEPPLRLFHPRPWEGEETLLDEYPTEKMSWMDSGSAGEGGSDHSISTGGARAANVPSLRRLWRDQVAALKALFAGPGAPPCVLDAEKWLAGGEEAIHLSRGLPHGDDKATSGTMTASSQLPVQLGDESVCRTSVEAAAAATTTTISATDGMSNGISMSDSHRQTGGSLHSMPTGLESSTWTKSSTILLRRTNVQPEAVGDDGTPLTKTTAMEMIHLASDATTSDDVIQSILQDDDIVVIYNDVCSCNDAMKLADRFQILRDSPLGAGSHGKVFRAWDELRGSYLAAKVLPLDGRQNHASAVREVLQEYTTLTELCHPNIVRVVAFMVVNQTGQIFMEWMPSGSVQDVLHRSPHGVLRESVASRYAGDALAGLNYLHHLGVLHRDVKPGNMLLSADGAVKLTDFGTSHVLRANRDTLETDVIQGTVPYMAPEVAHGIYSAASDIWSLGCSVVEMVTGKAPWANPATDSMVETVPLLYHIGSLDDTANRGRPHSHLRREGEEAEGQEGPISATLPRVTVSHELHSFLELIFVADRTQRPSAAVLLQHPFITKYRALWTGCSLSGASSSSPTVSLR